MYPRSSSKTPVLPIVIGAALFVFGGFALYSGILTFLNNGGNIATALTVTVISAANLTEQSGLNPLPAADQAVALPTRLPTRTPIKPCLDFRVVVIKARVRECPKDSCPTLDTMYNQEALVCVFGAVAENPDWYEINLRPDAPYPEIAYMHASVLYAVRPTPRPTRTPTGLPTVTPVPTTKLTRMPTPLPLPVQPRSATLNMSAEPVATSAR